MTVIQTEDMEQPDGLPEYKMLDKDNVILIQEVQDGVDQENAKAQDDAEYINHVEILMSLASASETDSEAAEVLRLRKRSTRVKSRKQPK